MVDTRHCGRHAVTRSRSAGSVARLASLSLAVVCLQTGCAGGTPGSVRVVVPPGASMGAAAESLAVHGVIASARMFRLYATVRGSDRHLRAGTYLLRRDASWADLLDALVSGRGLVYVVTVPEGWELRQIIPALVSHVGVPVESLEVAVRDTELLHRLDVPTPTLEGYLFPETYVFTDGASARDIVRTMVAEFERRWKPEWNDRLAALAMSRNDIITLASIIEKEARLPEERPVISAVYANRLRLGMALQADPTVQFALGHHVARVRSRDLAVKSSYNTYLAPGLPPGPIASPGTASIEAALFPASVKYLYFVAHPDGHHEFRRTFREHQEAVRLVRAERRALEQSGKSP
jgi:peptidoglycan lytic transglycosylase G